MMKEEKLSLFERGAVASSVVVLLIATMVGPRLNPGMARDELAVANAHKTRHISQLAASLTTARQDQAALRTQAAQTEQLLDKVRSELDALMQERDALVAQVAVANQRVQELETRLQTTHLEAARLKEFLSLQEIKKERDEAMDKATKAEDRIRELTLQLHRAGVWP